MDNKFLVGKFLPFLWEKANHQAKFRLILAILLILTVLALNLGVPILFREIINSVPQDTKLFNDTLRNNIKYNKPECTEQEIANAIRGAHLEHCVSLLPSGLDTLVGERGIKLSGGEKQRVAIARLILKNPDIMIFDEATSALDLHTEKEIQKCINEITTNKTTMVIAHRLSTIQHADEIIVLDKGKIIEQGDHKSLLKRKGMYAELWGAQKQNENRYQSND